MQLQAIFVYDRFASQVEALAKARGMVIPQNIVMRMGVFFSKFALGHTETPRVNFRGFTGYFNETGFSHRGIVYHLHFALVLEAEAWVIRLTLYTQGKAVFDETLLPDTFLTLSSRVIPASIHVHSTIASITRDLTQLYYRTPHHDTVIESAVKTACVNQVAQFKNHVNGHVKLRYDNERFHVHDSTLQFSRLFHLPLPYAKLCQPVLADYLAIGTPLNYRFEPTFNNADRYKVVGTKRELLQFIKEDFRLSVRLPAILRHLLHQTCFVFKDTLVFTVGSHDRPVITVSRIKPSSHKKIHYIINNTIIKSLAEI